MSGLLAGIGKIFNGVKYDFPLEACIASVLEGADEFVLTVCTDSEDNTHEYCVELQKKFNGRLKILLDVWRETPAENYTNMTRLANKAIDASNCDWFWSIDMDEIVPTGEANKLAHFLRHQPIGVTCAMVNFNHLYIDLEHKILGKLYDKIHRVAKAGFGWRSGMDGCGLGGGSGRTVSAPVVVNHYGFVRDMIIMIEKESRFQSELFHSGVPGLPDQRLIDFKRKTPESKKAFYDAFVSPNDTVIPYDGPPHHPLAIQKYGDAVS